MAYTRDDVVRMLDEEDDLINSSDDDLEMDGDEEECEVQNTKTLNNSKVTLFSVQHNTTASSYASGIYRCYGCGYAW